MGLVMVMVMVMVGRGCDVSLCGGCGGGAEGGREGVWNWDGWYIQYVVFCLRLRD